MAFKKELPEWNNQGTKPPQTKINSGWLPDDRPPADWWNWKDNRTYEAIKELQENAVHKGEELSKNLTINAGTQTVNAAINSPVNVKRIDGKTIVNIPPLFDSGLWVKHPNSTINIPSPNKYVLTSNGDNQATTLIVQVKRNTNYTISAVSNGKITVENVNRTTLITQLDAPSKTFNTGENDSIAIVLINTTANGTFTFENVSLVEGSQAQPFVANVKGVTNPTIANETNGTSLVVPTTLYDGEYVEQNANGELVKYKKWQEVTDFTSLVTTLPMSSYPDRKEIALSAPLGGKKGADSIKAMIVKYNGTILKNRAGAPNTQSDEFYLHENGNFYLSIANTDSGWGPNYTPTPEELKAFLLGWKLYDKNSNPNGDGVYNGSGEANKAWVGLAGWNGKDYTGPLGLGTFTLPTTKHAHAKPYRLIYELATPVQEVIQPYSDLTLDKGDNSIKVYAGRIVNERAIYVKDVEGSANILRWNLNNGSNVSYSNSLTKYKVDNFKGVYENNTNILTEHILYPNTTTIAGALAQLDLSLFNPLSSYTVDYEPLYTWEVTAPIDNVQLQYFETLVAVTNELVHDVAKQQDTVKRMLENVVNEESGLVWIRPTFLNGVTGGPTCRYAKSTHGTVYLFIYINISKAMTDTENLFVLPKGFRPKDTIYTPSIEYIGIDTATRKSGIMSVHASGHIRVGVPTGYATGTIIATVTFKAED